MLYLVTCRQLVPDEALSKPDDRIDNPAGSYSYEVDSEDEALDEFHGSVAIGCLDDFEVSVAPGALASDTTVREAFGRLSAARQAEILHGLREVAVDQGGCTWPQIETAICLDGVCETADWDEDVLAEVLGSVAPMLFAEAGFVAEG